MRNLNGHPSERSLPANLLVGALPLAALTLPSGPNIVYGLLALFALAELIRRHVPGAPAFSDRPLILALLAMPLAIPFNLLTHEVFEWREMEPVLLWILILPVFFYLRRLAPDMRFFAAGSALGAVGAAIAAAWQTTLGGQGRADGFTHWLPFGEISILLAFFSLAGLRLSTAAGWRILMGLGFATGMMATLLSGSRGAWLAAPLLLLLIALIPRPRCWRALAIRLTMIGTAGVLVFLVPPVSDRLDLAIAEYDQHRSSDTFIWSSVGVRMELWQGANLLIEERPVLGHGIGRFPLEYRRLHKEGLVRFDGENRHAHNQYLHTLAEEGVVGLTLLMFFLIVPAARFLSASRHGGAAAFAGLSGLMLVAVYLTFGLTQVFVAHNITIVFLAACLAIFLASASRQPPISSGQSGLRN